MIQVTPGGVQDIRRPSLGRNILLRLDFARGLPGRYMVVDQLRVDGETAHRAILTGTAHSSIDRFCLVGEVDDFLCTFGSDAKMG